MQALILFLELMLINIVLSGDNAVVIAMASKNLPPSQRKLAVFWGTLGAIVLRIALTVAAVFLLKVPYIQAAGSFLLMYIAVKLLLDDDAHTDVRDARNAWNAVWTIMVADFIMSLDNVLAVAAVAKGDYLLLLLGIGFSIPLIVWGSTLIMKLLHQYPVFVYLGAGILGYTAGEMFIGDAKVKAWLTGTHPLLQFSIPVGATLFVIGAGIARSWYKRHVIRVF